MNRDTNTYVVVFELAKQELIKNVMFNVWCIDDNENYKLK